MASCRQSVVATGIPRQDVGWPEICTRHRDIGHNSGGAIHCLVERNKKPVKRAQFGVSGTVTPGKPAENGENGAAADLWISLCVMKC